MEKTNQAKQIKEPEVKQPESIKSFDNMKLKDELLRGLYAYGFEKPSIIQSLAILPLVQKRNIIAQAQSGSGKTGAFSIGALSHLDHTNPRCQILILCPVRELAIQTQKVILALGDYMNITCQVCIGGTRIIDDVNNLKNGCQVVVGTPGRIYDLICRKVLSTSDIKIIILDEADEMLSLNFKNQIYDVITTLPKDVQIGLFSASFPEECLKLTEKFVIDPVKILVSQKESVLEGLYQCKIDVEKEDFKMDVLLDIYQNNSVSQTFVFCNQQQKAEWIANNLIRDGHAVSYSHGKMTRDERNASLQAFRLGKTRIIVTTDLLARGIDIQQVSLVVNYDLPKDYENYLHRIGRAARFGRKGIAINFVTTKDKQLMKDIESYYQMNVPDMPNNLDFF